MRQTRIKSRIVTTITGFGPSAFNIERTVKSLIKAGAAACHIEDQVGAKRCGHRPGKEIVTTEEMVDRVKAAADAKIAMLDLAISQPSVDVLRDQGFLQGFGVDLKDPNKWGDEDDPRVVGHDVSGGNEEGGRKAMENLLITEPDINLVYTINEPTAAGAFEALKAVGREGDVLIVSVDGGCPGVKNVAEGIIGGTSQQYPLLMASLGIEAIKKFAETGEKPKPTEGKDFFDTGTALITEDVVVPPERLPQAVADLQQLLVTHGFVGADDPQARRGGCGRHRHRPSGSSQGRARPQAVARPGGGAAGDSDFARRLPDSRRGRRASPAMDWLRRQPANAV